MPAFDIGLVGGCGHVGLPLALLFADAGQRTVVYDIDRDRLAAVRAGEMPFMEDGADELLPRVLADGTLQLHDHPAALSACDFIFLIVGTPVDEHLNPSISTILRTVDSLLTHLRPGQTLILRSTVYPGLSHYLQKLIHDQGLDVSVAFCPERVTQGNSLRELRELPQVVSAFDAETLAKVRRLFDVLGVEQIEMAPMEAELCKLMTNAWRYMQFAAVNQFYMIAAEHDLDFDRILNGCRHKYPRMAGMPGPGFAAGPCLVKDTMQLAAFSQNTFQLGHAAMLVNEGLPAFLVQQAKQRMDLQRATAGVLGMAFKADSDDARDSLSYKLRKQLVFEARTVRCTDPFVRDPTLVPLAQVLAEADVLFVGVPHSAYRSLQVPAGTLVIDTWGCLEEQACSAGHVNLRRVA